MERRELMKTKGHRIFYDGTWISNGAWLTLGERVRLSHVGLDLLLRKGIPFRFEDNDVTTNDPEIPDLVSVIPDLKQPHEKVDVTPICYRTPTMEMIRGIIFRTKGYLICIDSEFADILNWADELRIYERGGPVVGIEDGEAVALVMPVFLDGGTDLINQVESLHRLLTENERAIA